MESVKYEGMKMQKNKELMELIRKRNSLRIQEKGMTNQIKHLRKEISKSKRKPKIDFQSHPLLREARNKLKALRISCRKALKEAGYDRKRISGIVNISYGLLMQQEAKLIREAGRLEFETRPKSENENH